MAITTIPIHPIPNAMRTTCPHCGIGYGVLATPQAGDSISIQGDPTHPANAGHLYMKGSTLRETVSLEGCLLYPAIRQRLHDLDAPIAPLQRVTWDTALDTVAQGFRRIIDEHGLDAVVFYVSGQLLTENYYVANKLVKGFVGTANIDANSRPCILSAAAGHKRALGEDFVPVCYGDLEAADFIVLAGLNTAQCHPILFQRIVRVKEARPEMKVVVVDPCHAATCELADLHLPIKPDTDVRLFNGLLSFLSRRGVVDGNFVMLHANGPDAALKAVGIDSDDVEAIAKACKLKLDDLLMFYSWFADTERTIITFSIGVNQPTAGTDEVNSVINCHLLTGRIGRAGMGSFSIISQPNATGGREVGGLANMLAAHMELNDPSYHDLVQTFWASPRMADRMGLKAVDLSKAAEDGRVKAAWIIDTNPVVSLPDADQARRALVKCRLVVASDIVEATDTTALADILLPVLGWGEKDGTATNSERCISRQRAFLPALGEAHANRDVIADVARRMGYDGFDFKNPGNVSDEHARLSAHTNDASGIRRAFRLGGLARLGVGAYDDMSPVQWPTATSGNSEARFFSDGHFAHTDGHTRFVPTPAHAPVHVVDDDYPFILNTGRVRDQWYTMTRTGRALKLADHASEPFVGLHPHDALLAGMREGNLVRVSSRWGSVVTRVRMTGDIAHGSVFVPIHWNGQSTFDARVGTVVNPVVDPVSGKPEFKHTPVMVEPFDVAWHDFVLSRSTLDIDDATWWMRIQGKQFVRYELADRQQLDSVHNQARALLGVTDPHADWLEYEDTTARVYRAVHVVDGRIEACVFLSSRPDLPSRNWLAGLFAQERLEDTDCAGMLSGQPIEAGIDVGPTVCSCFGVDRNTICDAIRTKGPQSTGEITTCLKAGGNYGSCVPELRRLLVEARVQQVT